MYSEDMEEQEEVVESTNNSGGSNIIKYIICGILIIAIIVLVYLLLKGKSNGGGNEVNKTYTVKIVPETEVVIPIGNTYYLTASVTDESGNMLANPELRWTVDNQDVITIDNGNIKAIDYGKSNVTAAYVDNNGKIFQDSKEIVVADGDINTPVTDINIFEGDLFLPPNGTYELKLTVIPTNGYVSNKTYMSSNDNVVKVSKDGLVTAVSEGEAVITVSINDGAITKSFKVFVENDIVEPVTGVYPTGITLDKKTSKMKLGETVTIRYDLTPSDAKTDRLKWTSSDPEVLSVDANGNVKALKSGIAKIILSSDNVSDEVEISVEGEIEKIDFNQPEISLDYNNRATMYVTIGYPVVVTPVITPTEATNPMLDFVQLDPTIINVTKDSTGTFATIDGLAEGTTELVVKSTNNVENRIYVTVIKKTDGGGSSGGGGATYRCYCNSSSKCQWASSKKSDYTEVQSRIPNSTACSIYSNNYKQACFKDKDGVYHWGSYGSTSGYTYVAGISNSSSCKATTTVNESLTCASTFKGQTGTCVLTSAKNTTIKDVSVGSESIAKITKQTNTKVTFECVNDKSSKQASTQITVKSSSGKTVRSYIVCKPLSSISLICPTSAVKGESTTCSLSGIDSASQLESCSSDKGTVKKDGKTCVVTYDGTGTVKVTAKTTLGQSVSRSITYQKSDKTMDISCPTGVTITGSSTTATCTVSTTAKGVSCSASGASASYKNGKCTITYSGTTGKEVTVTFKSSETSNYTRKINFTGQTLKPVTLNCPSLAKGSTTCTIEKPDNTFKLSGKLYFATSPHEGNVSLSISSTQATITYSGTDTVTVRFELCSSDDKISIAASGAKCLNRSITFNPPSSNAH